MQVHVWLYQVVVGVVLGAAIGHVAGVVLRWAAHRRLIESESLFAFSIVLALAVVGRDLTRTRVPHDPNTHGK